MYNQIVHIEGIDRSGKDTLRRKIVQETKGEYLVIARSFLSQIVYNRIYKRKINENFFWDRFVHANLACDEKFFYLFCDQDIIANRIKETSEKDINASQISHHLAVFQEVIKEAEEKWGVEIHQINTSGMTVDNTYLLLQNRIITHEINYCNDCQLCSREVNKKDFSKGYGKLIPVIRSFYPKYLIVGMNPSNSRLANTEIPFAINDSDNKNEVFLNILKKYGIYEKSVITNSVKCSTENNKITHKDFKRCKHHLEAELEIFRPTYIVCLGDNVRTLIEASTAFKNTEIIQIYHPAYQYTYRKLTEQEYEHHILTRLKHTL